MSVDQANMTFIVCDNHEDDPIGVVYENTWGDQYFESSWDAVKQARADGWEIAEDRWMSPALCPDCVKAKAREAAGLTEPQEQIPGQTDLLAELAATGPGGAG